MYFTITFPVALIALSSLKMKLPDTIVFLGYIYLPYLFGINTLAVDFHQKNFPLFIDIAAIKTLGRERLNEIGLEVCTAEGKTTLKQSFSANC
jgi:hypothetical protein